MNTSEVFRKLEIGDLEKLLTDSQADFTDYYGKEVKRMSDGIIKLSKSNADIRNQISSLKKSFKDVKSFGIIQGEVYPREDKVAECPGHSVMKGEIENLKNQLDLMN